LTLTLQGGADGAMKLLIVGADGTILALDATVTEDGTVLIELQGALENLAVSVRNAGGSAVVAYEQPVAARPGSDGAASEVPGGNQAGGEGDAPDGDNGARADENPGNGPNQNAGDNPDENAGDGAPDQGPN